MDAAAHEHGDDGGDGQDDRGVDHPRDRQNGADPGQDNGREQERTGTADSRQQPDEACGTAVTGPLQLTA
ncbi:hypothetical protein [Streptomyces sp. SID14436]|uniref:hypothetical protein n=1 Tax=Streptomyces sp. SID14436 TaxID=2706070 RepID=UPI0013DD46AE|nr:hypothetical protein [Streptomyces sp. SID14436]